MISRLTTLHVQGQVHWTEPFVRRLRGDVKLVGPTISCEGSPLNGDVRGKWRRNPHVQSYAIATDRVSGVGKLICTGSTEATIPYHSMVAL